MNNITKEQVIEFYINKNHSRLECAEIFNISERQFRTLLSRYNIRKERARVIEKRCQTNQKRYGGNSPACNPKVVNKMKTTKLLLYGSEGYNNIEQIKQTNLKKYGVENISQAIDSSKRVQMQEKAKQTCVKKYGSEDYWNSEILKNSYIQQKEKSKETCLRKYKKEFYTQSDDFKNRVNARTVKTKKTNLEKYGVENVSQYKDFSKKKGITYMYKNNAFDSSWELALWIYCEDHNEKIIRCPCSFEYMYQNTKHYYIPDFEYNGNIIEIKGPQFFKNDLMVCPFDHSLDGLYNAKYQCMKKNGIKVWGKSDLDFALNYIIEKYGSNYLKQFKKIYD